MWILLYKLFIEFLDPAYNKHPIIFPRAALMNEFCVVSKTVFLKMYAWCLLALHVILNKSSTGGSSCGKKRSCGVVLEKGLMQHLVLKALMMTGYMACQVVVYPLRLTLLTDCYVPKLFCLNLTRHAEWKIIIIIMTLELYSTFFPLKSPSVWPAIPFLIWLFNTFPSVLLRNSSLCKLVSFINGEHFQIFNCAWKYTLKCAIQSTVIYDNYYCYYN